MANTYGALKRVRQTERRTEFNRFAKTRLRHQIRTMRQTLAAKTPAPENIKTVMAATFSLVDKAARKGYIKQGTAARYKSRLHTRVKVLLGEVKKS
jgi:small subunit ribosomal protein S20